MTTYGPAHRRPTHAYTCTLLLRDIDVSRVCSHAHAQPRPSYRPSVADLILNIAASILLLLKASQLLILRRICIYAQPIKPSQPNVFLILLLY